MTEWIDDLIKEVAERRSGAWKRIEAEATDKLWPELLKKVPSLVHELNSKLPSGVGQVKLEEGRTGRIVLSQIDRSRLVMEPSAGCVEVATHASGEGSEQKERYLVAYGPPAFRRFVVSDFDGTEKRYDELDDALADVLSDFFRRAIS